ncbi:hypothetical protein ACF05L_14690 [Streptomyces bobili]|uniref:hypothetical protein n=1 Tax=Streptomyces bobili TaxID=67280 RepID=UPI0036FAA36E
MGKQQIDNFPTVDEWVNRQLETLLPSIDQDTWAELWTVLNPDSGPQAEAA